MKSIDLGKEKISKLLLMFSVPCVISMLINSIYNIVDQIFIGKGVGTLGNAATNVIFPLVIIFSAVAGLIGNGASANLSLRLGEGKKEEVRKIIGQAITLTFIVSILLSVLGYILLPRLLYMFGCTKNVYPYALSYGKVILMGAPFMLIYSALANIIRADGSPKYSMIMLVVGAVINIILDPIFINVLDMGVKGGALATVIGQFVSFCIAIRYVFKIKTVKLKKEDFKLNKTALKVLSLGLSSFITQMTILVLFVFMNNMMTKYGASSKFGADIPLSVYGVLSKINSLFISSVLGVSIGAQPIIGFNYGAGNYSRVKETLKKVLIINFIVGIVFNIIFISLPKELASLFISKTDSNYALFIEFAVLMCRSFLLVMAFNAMEITTSIIIQSLGNVKKATSVSFIRQIILFIPISILLANVLDKGVYGILYAGAISDVICFFVTIVIFKSEYKKLQESSEVKIESSFEKSNTHDDRHIVITISREYGSGGRYVGKLLANKLGVNFYDKEIISLAAKESGLSENYIMKNDQKKASIYENNNDDRIFIAESNIIKEKAKHESCVIVGRCADYVLKDDRNVFKVFLYSDDSSKINRAVLYYNLNKNNALKEINKINKERARHYEFYTNRSWKDINNYDAILNVDKYGVNKCVDLLFDMINKFYE